MSAKMYQAKHFSWTFLLQLLLSNSSKLLNTESRASFCCNFSFQKMCFTKWNIPNFWILFENLQQVRSITFHRHCHLFQGCLIFFFFFFFNFFLGEERLFWSSLVFVLMLLMLSQETETKRRETKIKTIFCLHPSYAVSSISNLNYTVKL